MMTDLDSVMGVIHGCVISTSEKVGLSPECGRSYDLDYNR